MRVNRASDGYGESILSEEKVPGGAAESGMAVPESKGGGSTSFSQVMTSARQWWHDEVTGDVDQAAVIEKRRQDCSLSERYLFMTAMSAGIANSSARSSS